VHAQISPICALALAASLAILPVSATLAMMHAAKPDVAMMATSDDCPCCKPAVSNTCLFKCCHVQALVVDGRVLSKPASPVFFEPSVAFFVAVVLGPDPPPPRFSSPER
jgi:hypothetical protein